MSFFIFSLHVRSVKEQWPQIESGPPVRYCTLTSIDNDAKLTTDSDANLTLCSGGFFSSHCLFYRNSEVFQLTSNEYYQNVSNLVKNRKRISLRTEAYFRLSFAGNKSAFTSFSSPEAALLLVSTKNRDLWPGPTPEVRDSRTSRHSAHVQSQVWQIWLVLVSIYCVYKAIQKRNAVGPGQRSRFLVLTKRSAASGDENAFTCSYH